MQWENHKGNNLEACCNSCNFPIPPRTVQQMNIEDIDNPRHSKDDDWAKGHLCQESQSLYHSLTYQAHEQQNLPLLTHYSKKVVFLFNSTTGVKCE